VDSVIDTMGSNEVSSLGDFPFAGNLVCVDSTRRLTQLQAALSLPAPAELTWSVRENLPDGFHTIASVHNQHAAGMDFFSSGPLDVQLKAGSCYLLGVDGLPEATTLYSRQGVKLPRLSFGYTMGAWADGSTPQSLYLMRVATELPPAVSE
jgi:hypothetical protein